MGVDLFLAGQADRRMVRQTDKPKLKAAFRTCAKAPKIVQVLCGQKSESLIVEPWRYMRQLVALKGTNNFKSVFNKLFDPNEITRDNSQTVAL